MFKYFPLYCCWAFLASFSCSFAASIMDIGTCVPKTMRDCGTQLRQHYLSSHLQKFEVKSKAASSISEDNLRVLLLDQPINRTLNKSTQTGRYGPWDKQGNIRCRKRLRYRPRHESRAGNFWRWRGDIPGGPHWECLTWEKIMLPSQLLRFNALCKRWNQPLLTSGAKKPARLSQSSLTRHALTLRHPA